jgi:SAM-dependent methyltransferase
MADYCPVCKVKDVKILGGSKTNSISSKFLTSHYDVVQCKNCQIYFVSPEIPFSDKQWAALYNSEYFSNQTNWLIKQRNKDLIQRFDRAESFIGKKKINFLDIGTGEGKTLIEAQNRGWKSEGIDIVDNRIEDAKLSNIKFIEAKFLEYEFPDDNYDFIYLDSVLEHVLSPLEYLIKIKRILKPGGIVYIGVPNEDSLFNDIRRLAFNFTGKNGISEKIRPFDAPYHVVGFNLNSLNHIIKKMNFRIKYLRNFSKKFYFLSAPPTHRSFWISLIFLFPIEIIAYLTRREIYFEAFITKE